MLNSIPRSIFIGGAMVLLLGASFLFREKIGEFLSFGEKHPPAPVLSEIIPRLEGPGSRPTEVGLGTAEKSPEKPAPTLYTGRNPGEIRPVPEEVRLFNEEQKQRLYETLQSHAIAVKNDPNYFFGWIQVGILKKTIGDFEGARDAWEYAGIIQPKNSLSFANLGELYWHYLKDYPRAEKNLKMSIEYKPDDIQTRVTFAELYHYSMPEKAELADDVLLDGLKANPDNGTLMRRLAYLYEQRKEYSLALEVWEKVLMHNLEDVDIKERISKLKAKVEGGS